VEKAMSEKAMSEAKNNSEARFHRNKIILALNFLVTVEPRQCSPKDFLSRLGAASRPALRPKQFYGESLSF
jgi:hypothetical protein